MLYLNRTCFLWLLGILKKYLLLYKYACEHIFKTSTKIIEDKKQSRGGILK